MAETSKKNEETGCEPHEPLYLQITVTTVVEIEHNSALCVSEAQKAVRDHMLEAVSDRVIEDFTMVKQSPVLSNKYAAYPVAIKYDDMLEPLDVKAGEI